MMYSGLEVPEKELFPFGQPENAHGQQMADRVLACSANTCGALPKEASLMATEGAVSRKGLVYVEGNCSLRVPTGGKDSYAIQPVSDLLHLFCHFGKAQSNRSYLAWQRVVLTSKSTNYQVEAALVNASALSL